MRPDGVHAWRAGERHVLRGRPGEPAHYLLLSDHPFDVLAEDGQPAPASWRGDAGVYVAQFMDDGQGADAVGLLPRSRDPENPGRYEIYRSSVPFQLVSLNHGGCGPVRPALEDPPCGADFPVQVAFLAAGADKPASVSWELRGAGESPITAADVACEGGAPGDGTLLRGTLAQAARSMPCRITNEH